MSSCVRPGVREVRARLGAAGERVDERGLADVRAPGESDLRRSDRRQAVGTRGGEDEVAWAREELAPGLRPVRRGRRFAHTLGVLAGLRANSLVRLSQSSTFTPALVMM